MAQQNFFQYIVQSIRSSGIIGRIMAVNAVIFLLFLLLRIGEFLFIREGLTDAVLYYFAAPGDPAELAVKPWSVITQMFTHRDFGHFLLNMLVFFFSGRIFVQFFGSKRLLTVYVMGGIFAYLFHIGAYYAFPVFASGAVPSVIGASGAIMAVFMAVAFYQPSMRVMFFGVVPVPLIIIAALYLLMDLTGIAQPRQGANIAHLAHLGGAIFGILSIVNIHSPKNWLNRFDNWIYQFKKPRFSFGKRPKMKAYKGGNVRSMTDEEFNLSKKQRQDRVDAILEKISKKGYEGLTKEEKDFLFNESQRK